MSPSWAGWPFSLQLEIENWPKNKPKFDFVLKSYFWLIFIINLFSKRIIYEAKSYCLKTTESHVNCKRTACTSFYSVSQSLYNLCCAVFYTWSEDGSYFTLGWFHPTTCFYFSMTQLLTHSVAHSTKPSSRPKTNNQPLKKFLSLAYSWVKVVKNWTSF